MLTGVQVEVLRKHTDLPEIDFCYRLHDRGSLPYAVHELEISTKT